MTLEIAAGSSVDVVRLSILHFLFLPVWYNLFLESNHCGGRSFVIDGEHVLRIQGSFHSSIAHWVWLPGFVSVCFLMLT
ncbi:MAG: hypothetical protein ACLTSZ_14830 [Lachnospiraceae bacterium]